MSEPTRASHRRVSTARLRAHASSRARNSIERVFTRVAPRSARARRQFARGQRRRRRLIDSFVHSFARASIHRSRRALDAQVRRAREQVLRPRRRPDVGETERETSEQEDCEIAKPRDEASAREKSQSGGETGEP